MRYIIGIDVGTTHTKAIVVGSDGRVFHETKASYPTARPRPGYHEQDPEQVYIAFIEVLTKAVAAISDQNAIVGVCFSAAMHGFMALGANNVPLTPFLTWADIRSQSFALALRQTELGKRLHRETGTAVHPMSPLCKTAWLRNELPDIFAHSVRFISIKEFIFFRLFGSFVIDYSIASATGMFQTRSLQWFPDALAWAGITSDQLSTPVPTDYSEILQNDEIKNRLGLIVDIPFIIGSSDGCLAVLGSGAILPNEVALTIGTSAAVRMTVKEPIDDKQQRLFNYILEEGWYVSGGASNNGGNVLKWFSEMMLDRPFETDQAFNWFMNECASVSPGSDGLFFLPYVYGERSPVWDADARGLFFYVGANHGKAHFMRSILEGICFSLKEILTALEEAGPPIDTIYASGGFIESPLWLHILADVTGKKVLISHEGDASALGAAFIGMAATGVIHSLSEAKSLTRTGEIILPNQENQELYGKNYFIFRRLISAERSLRAGAEI